MPEPRIVPLNRVDLQARNMSVADQRENGLGMRIGRDEPRIGNQGDALRGLAFERQKWALPGLAVKQAIWLSRGSPDGTLGIRGIDRGRRSGKVPRYPRALEAAYLEARATSLRLAGEEGIDRLLREFAVDALVAPTTGPAWTTDLLLGDHWVGGTGAGSLAAIAGYPHLTVPMKSRKPSPSRRRSTPARRITTPPMSSIPQSRR